MSFIEPTEETQASHHRNTIYVAGNLTGGRRFVIRVVSIYSKLVSLSKY